MKSFYILIAFIIYAFLKQVMKGRRKEKTLREATIRKETAQQINTTFEPQVYDSSGDDVERALAKLRGRAVTIPEVPAYSQSFDQSVDYQETDESQAEQTDSTFRPNEGFTKKERFDLDRSFEAVTDAAKPRAYKFAYTSDTIRNYFIMKEVLEAPRVLKPFLARRSYYDPHDTSRE